MGIAVVAFPFYLILFGYLPAAYILHLYILYLVCYFALQLLVFLLAGNILNLQNSLWLLLEKKLLTRENRKVR